MSNPLPKNERAPRLSEAEMPYFVIVARRNLFGSDETRFTLITLRTVFAGTGDASVEGSTDTPIVLQLPAEAKSVLVSPPSPLKGNVGSSVRKTTTSRNLVGSLLSIVGKVGVVPSLPPNP